jgi:hypothetical protein
VSPPGPPVCFSLRSTAAQTRRASAATPPASRARPQARKVLGWPKRRKLAHAFLWEYSYKRLQLAQLLGQLGIFRTS